MDRPDVNLYRVEWRGTVTRDVGFEEIEANDMDDARGWFEASYPMRSVVAVSLIPKLDDAQNAVRVCRKATGEDN